MIPWPHTPKMNATLTGIEEPTTRPSMYMEMLQAFSLKYEHAMEKEPVHPDADTRELRIRLMREELKELIDAMDMKDMIEVADGLADLLYVVFGTAVAYGIPMDAIFGEVHRSNMTKSMHKDEGGKSIKGPDFEKPQLREVLHRHGWLG